MAKKPVKKAAPAKAKAKATKPAAAKKPVRAPKAAPKAAKRVAKPKAKGPLASAAALFRPVKQSVTIRLDSDVVAWFKKQADKYQTEINSVLRNHATKRGL